MSKAQAYLLNKASETKLRPADISVKSVQTQNQNETEPGQTQNTRRVTSYATQTMPETKTQEVTATSVEDVVAGMAGNSGYFYVNDRKYKYEVDRRGNARFWAVNDKGWKRKVGSRDYLLEALAGGQKYNYREKSSGSRGSSAIGGIRADLAGTSADKSGAYLQDKTLSVVTWDEDPDTGEKTQTITYVSQSAVNAGKYPGGSNWTTGDDEAWNKAKEKPSTGDVVLSGVNDKGNSEFTTASEVKIAGETVGYRFTKGGLTFTKPELQEIASQKYLVPDPETDELIPTTRNIWQAWIDWSKQNKALEALSAYETKPDYQYAPEPGERGVSYDLIGYLKDNPDGGDMLLAAGFQEETVEKAKDTVKKIEDGELVELPSDTYMEKSEWDKLPKGTQKILRKGGFDALDETMASTYLYKGNVISAEERAQIIADYEAKRDDLAKAGKMFSDEWDALGSNPRDTIQATGTTMRRKSIEAATFVFPPAKAALPEYTIQDVSGLEWGIGAANVAMFVLPIATPARFATTALGRAITASVTTAAAGVYTAETIKSWPEMSNVERGISVALDTLILAGAVHSLMPGAKAATTKAKSLLSTIKRKGTFVVKTGGESGLKAGAKVPLSAEAQAWEDALSALEAKGPHYKKVVGIYRAREAARAEALAEELEKTLSKAKKARLEAAWKEIDRVMGGPEKRAKEAEAARLRSIEAARKQALLDDAFKQLKEADQKLTKQAWRELYATVEELQAKEHITADDFAKAFGALEKKGIHYKKVVETWKLREAAKAEALREQAAKEAAVARKAWEKSFWEEIDRLLGGPEKRAQAAAEARIRALEAARKEAFQKQLFESLKEADRKLIENAWNELYATVKKLEANPVATADDWARAFEAMGKKGPEYRKVIASWKEKEATRRMLLNEQIEKELAEAKKARLKALKEDLDRMLGGPEKRAKELAEKQARIEADRLKAAEAARKQALLDDAFKQLNEADRKLTQQAWKELYDTIAELEGKPLITKEAKLKKAWVEINRAIEGVSDAIKKRDVKLLTTRARNLELAAGELPKELGGDVIAQRARLMQSKPGDWVSLSEKPKDMKPIEDGFKVNQQHLDILRKQLEKTKSPTRRATITKEIERTRKLVQTAERQKVTMPQQEIRTTEGPVRESEALTVVKKAKKELAKSKDSVRVSGENVSVKELSRQLSGKTVNGVAAEYDTTPAELVAAISILPANIRRALAVVSPDLATYPEISPAPAAEPKGEVKPAPSPSPKPEPSPQPEQVPQPRPDPALEQKTHPETQTETKTKPQPEPKTDILTETSTETIEKARLKWGGPAGGKPKLTPKQRAGATAWPQGFGWWIVYKDENGVTRRYFHHGQQPPEWIKRVRQGPGEAYRGIQQVGKGPQKFNMPMGAVVVKVEEPDTEPGKKGAISFGQETYRKGNVRIVETSETGSTGRNESGENSKPVKRKKRKKKNIDLGAGIIKSRRRQHVRLS